MSRLKKIAGAIWNAPDRFDLLAERIANTDERVYEVNKILSYIDGSFSEIQGGELSFVRRLVRQMGEDPEMMTQLNRSLRMNPTVIGSWERLHIAKTAAVQACEFNTVSGEIRIGEYVRAGMGASLLTESADIDLRGLPRQDVPLDHCDITVEDGAFLGSRCLLLGPCRVGKNAAVLPGSIVLPGTEIPADSVWSGCPAREAEHPAEADLEKRNRMATRKALERNGGILFLDGWSGKVQGIWDTPAHLLCRESGELLVSRAEWTMDYQKEHHRPCELKLQGPEGTWSRELTETEGQIRLRLPVSEPEGGRIRFEFPAEEQLMIAMRPA